MDAHLGDEGRIEESGEHATELLDHVAKVDLSLDAVLETQPEPMTAEVANGDDVLEDAGTHRIDPTSSAARRAPGVFPLAPSTSRHELVAVRGRPAQHESARPRRKVSVQDPDGVDPDPAQLARTTDMDVGRRVVVVVHEDHDAEETGDLGHLGLRWSREA
jgi:hypothetical protein